MPQLFSLIRPTVSSLRLLLLLSLVTWLAGSPPLDAASPESCREALPLPLDHSIHGYATGREPARYAVEVTVPSLLVTEAHGTGSPPVSPAVGLLDRACRPQATNLPLPMIRGRHVHRVDMPGTYFVEVATVDLANGADLADGGFRLDAWLVPAPGAAAGVLKDGGDGGDGNEDPPREPMDEWDESLGGGIGEPIAATTAYKTPREPSAWREIAGHGVVELVETPGGRETRVHPWCPWAERPGLLRTFTCAPQLRLDESGTLVVHPLFPEISELVGLRLATAGRIALEVPGESGGSAALFDARGRLIAELVNGEPIELAAGRYYLQVETSAGDAMRLDAELD